MRKFSLIIILFLGCFACKNETKTEVNLEENRAKSYDENDGFVTVKGEFIYYKDAAVFQVRNEIYGVVLDENAQKLNELAQPLKKDDSDGIMATLRVRKFEKPANEQGWPNRIEIKEILKVEASNRNKEDVIKLGN